MRALLLLLAGCWTGAAPEPTPPPASELPSAFEITLQRTPCLGRCPVYTVTIDGDGRVKWKGEQNVVVTGKRRATIPQRRIREIEAKLDEVKFFTLDENGEPPDPGPQCVRTATSTSCSLSRTITICSDTTRAIITVRRRDKTHRVANDHCDPSPLDALEALIDDIAHTNVWIGDRVTL
jgi:hypothetical protein